MKKLSIGMLAVAVTLLVGGSSVYAADSSPISQEVGIAYRNACISECFADKNGDGVCDLRFSRQIANEQVPNNLMNVSTSKGNGNFVDEDGDGVCDNRPNGGNGNFVDGDGDGVCDNRPNGGNGNFVDEDGDGVCDNRPNGGNGNFVDEDGDGVCDNRSNGENGRNGAGQNQAQKTSSGLGYRRACHQR